MLFEAVLLTLVGFSDSIFQNQENYFHIASYVLLFAMGLQNALVTKASQSTVRTTHLTGLFTDLGIELSQLFFYKKTEEKNKLSKSIYLKLSIITFFFLGCIIGGFIFQTLKLSSIQFGFVLVIKGVPEAYLSALQDALQLKLKSTLKVWALEANSVLVLNNEIAKQYGFIASD